MNKLSIELFFLVIFLVFTHFGLSQTLDIEKANYFYQKGLSSGNCDSSISYYSQAILYNPNVSEYYYERARCYYEKHEDENAIADFSKSISIKEWANNLYDRAQVYLQLFDENRNNITIAQKSLDDFLKLKSKYPNFEQMIEVDKCINELRAIVPSHSSYENLSNSLHVFHLKNMKTLYIKLPEIIYSAKFNIIKQDPKNQGPGTGEFLLFRGTKQQFLDSLVSCVDIIEKEGKLFIMTIDDDTRKGVQEDLLYGTDLNNLQSPDEHYTWIPKPQNKAWSITGWLKFDETTISEPENLITHNGTLRIRVLKNSQPVKIISSSISCAKYKTYEDFDYVYEKIVAISDCDVTYLNLRLALPDKTRWLLDKSADSLLMRDYILEINGKEFPNKMEYIDTNTNKGESADFIVHLKRVPK